MKRRGNAWILSSLVVAGLIWIFGTVAAPGQFTQNRDTIKIDSSSYSADIQKDYRLFRVKCGECHGLDTSLRPSMPSAQWTSVVKRMQAMASSHISDNDAKAILVFVNYDEARRKSLARPSVSAAPTTSVEAGRKFYYAQACDACHTIGGQGGQGGPALDGVAEKRSRDQLVERMRERRAGAVMPPLPTDTTDQQINDLVDFLMTLKDK